jgi:hypothetical protein
MLKERVKDKKTAPPRLHFAAIPLAAAANRRMGKHYKMVSQILSDLEKLDQYSALKVEFLKGWSKGGRSAGGCAPCRSEKKRVLGHQLRR